MGPMVGRVDLGPTENLHVALGRSLPREVRRHAPAHDLGPGLLVVLVGVERVPQTELQPVAVAPVELPARSLVLEGVVVLHRVLQPARVVHHRHSPVPLGVHLGQAARLVARGHHQDVRPRDHLVLELRGEADVAHHAALVGRLGVPQETRVPLLAGSDHDELHVSGDVGLVLVHEPAEDGLEDIDALLVRQAPHKRHHGHVGILLQAEYVLHVQLARALARHVVHRKEVVEALGLGGEEVVRGGVPLVRVDAVEDAVEMGEPAAAGVLQAEAALGREDLVFVCRRHCHHAVRHLDAAFQKLDAVVVDELVQIVAVGKPQRAVRHRPEPAPVAHVVDVEDGARVGVAAVAAVVRRHNERHEPHHPVVYQEHHVVPDGSPVLAGDAERCLQRRPRQQRETHEVVVVAVHAVALEAAVLHEDVVHPACRPLSLCRGGFAPAAPKLSPVPLSEELELALLAGVGGALIAEVEGRNSHDLMPKSGERNPKLVAHVGQTSRLGERRNL
mmetsp:Transcript_32830/g.87090  ORF Transcript_32830/g.87090 Transcript_32830/m.87090 type:complete len:503 (+) Transcript_32830:757-2265(+)